MPQKTFLIISIFFFVLGTIFLFRQNSQELDPDLGKNWWTLSFALPEQEESLSFIIENHSNQTNFSYEITVGKEIISKEIFFAKSGEKTTVMSPSIIKQNERVRITVRAGTEKKEIYR